MNILMLTIGFRPNVGGIETHFDDFLRAAEKRGLYTTVLTYQPISSHIRGKTIEKEKGWVIYRLPVVSGYFYKLVEKPILEFLYLVPGLFMATPFLLLVKNIDVIHAHGLIAGFVGVIWGKIFHKRVVVSTHSIYHFPSSGIYHKFAKFIFSSAHAVLCLSKQSVEEVIQLGVTKEKVKQFTYWIDLDVFKKIPNSKKILGWKEKFVVLFVGRLIPEKGVRQLLDASSLWNENITLAIAGVGPLEAEIKKHAKKSRNIKFLGNISNDRLPLYYCAADILIVPSVHEEGFGRVILESLACGTPVVASNRGAIPEALDKSVGVLIHVTPQNIVKIVDDLYKNSKKIQKMSMVTRRFVDKRYSEKNIDTIINCF